ncbi:MULTISPECIES: hypothetical protein [unclassified Pseudomonas]|uniref:hypothetical protein n=1 Tax=unclassified Pseudomonas TaxID=196821 RepID=UPI00244D5443|nr:MULTISPECIES: hypothetical protein [unclassified Pseudomonas]MDH0301637.1 hypothetical protein [Pseudomonas sp. GD04091]MDH1987253.1 hypothetical protein [Pseudomonas sp. GD03689]
MKSMLRTLKPLAVLAVAAGLVACQTASPNADTLKQRSQVTLGVPVSKVSNVRSDSSTTYFTAITAKGAYDCQVASGGMVAVAGMGLITPSPTCWKEGQAPVFQ